MRSLFSHEVPRHSISHQFVFVLILIVSCLISLTSSVDYEVLRDNYVYKILPESGTWSTLRSQCMTWRPKGNLASIWDAKEDDLLKDMGALSDIPALWLGGLTTYNTTTGTTNGTWIDGSEMVYQHWDAGEPNYAMPSGSSCMLLRVDDGVWRDAVSCDGDRYGVCKTVLQCNGLSVFDNSSCTGRGTCTSWDRCTCNSTNYWGSFCEYTYCDSVISYSSSACSSYGNCVDYNTCECDPNYSGTFCELWQCYGINNTNTSHVCGGRGTCSGHDSCSCPTNYRGSKCEVSLCYSVWGDDPTVCSGHGSCTDVDECTCASDGSYVGQYCAAPACYGLAVGDLSACSGVQGTCIGPNMCDCEPGFEGEKCQYPICGAYLANDSRVCSGNGTCDSPGHCTCDTGFTGTNCEYTICNSISSANPLSVCNGHGQCAEPDTCVCNSNYRGEWCDQSLCYGTWSNDSSVCSSHGVCSTANNCVCQDGYPGDQCQFFDCYGFLSNDSASCGGSRGTCTEHDQCTCAPGFTGDQCQFNLCYNVSSNDASVCSSHGNCIAPDTCVCDALYGGANCSFFDCYGILSNESYVCSGNGTCTAPTTCSCDAGYGGSQCSLSYCNAILSDNPAVCSSHGNCTAPDTCACGFNYFGTDCQEFGCGGIIRTDPAVCGGISPCTAPGYCDCPYGHGGDNCDPICFGIVGNTAGVCSGKGNCSTPDNCTCFTGYDGEQCQLSYCSGILSNESSVCSGRGSCMSADVCQCNTGYGGSNCELNLCGSLLSNETAVCSSHGSCVAPESCSCASGYTGPLCELNICSGTASDQSSVCSGRGICSSPEHCDCNPGYTGKDCELSLCFGIPSNLSSVCNSHGVCTAPNVCQCDFSGATGYFVGANCSSCDSFHQGPTCQDIYCVREETCFGHGECLSGNAFCTCDAGYGGKQCNVSSCFGVWSNETTVCSSHGSCSAPNTCQCEAGFGGENCQLIDCYGKWSNDSAVCNNGKGVCTAPDTCSCISSKYSGAQCELIDCFGRWNNDPLVCSGSGRGTCVAPDTCSCTSSGYGGEQCELNNCFGKWSNESFACSGPGRGNCIAPDTCSCASAGYGGEECELNNCFGKWSNDSSVCSGPSRGTCVAPDTCTCADPGYTGNTCELNLCFGTPSNSPSVCSSNGVCEAPDTCSCISSDYDGDQCQVINCYGTWSNDSTVCSNGRGTCVAPDTCSCTNSDYAGNTCELNRCFGYLSDENNVCSSHGTCTAPQNCVCDPGYFGSKCDQFECFGITYNNSNACGGPSRGQCVGPSLCSCNDGYSGISCDVTECFGKIDSDTTVCSGHGVCSGLNQCACDTGYAGKECELTTCQSIPSNDTSVCSTHGECVASDVCECTGNWGGVDCGGCAPGWAGINCTTAVCDCGGKGFCSSGSTVCTCYGNYAGPHCLSCKTDFFGASCAIYCNPQVSCNNHGNCSADGSSCQCSKDPQNGYFNEPDCSSCVSGWEGSSCTVRFNASSWKFNDGVSALEGIFYHATPFRQIDCSVLFPLSDDLQKLGIGPICRWADNAHTNGKFEVIFGVGPTLQPQDQLSFDIFLNSSTDGSKMVNAVVNGPSVSPVPEPHLTAPTEVGGCSTLVLDGSKSSSPDRRGLNYTWELLNSDASVAAIKSQLLQESSSIVTLQSVDSLLSGVTYYFQMNVTNFLGKQASTKIAVTKASDTVPLATVTGDLTITAQSDEYVLFDGNMQAAPCLNASQVTFAWQQTSGVNIDFKTASSGRRLIIDGTNDALRHVDDTYTFVFTVSLKANPSLKSTKTVTLNVKARPLGLRLVGGANKRVSKTSNITLSSSVDGYSESEVSFSWKCYNAKTGGLCPNSASLPKSGASIYIPGGSFDAGFWYLVVTAQRASLIETARVTLEVVKEAVPQINFETHPPRINRNDKLVLPSKLNLESSGLTVSYSWTVQEGGRTLSTSELASIAFTPVNKNTLGINENTLTEGVIYQFRIDGLASNGAAGYSTTSVYVNESPRPGTLTISPTSGQMVTTEFTFICSDWYDVDTPLSYSLKYIDPNTGAEKRLVAPTTSASFSSPIPVSGLASSDHSVTVVLYVSDKYGASRRFQKSVKVQPLPSDPAAFMSAISSSFEKQKEKLALMSSTEKLSMVGLFSSALSYGGDSSSGSSAQAMREDLFSLVDSATSTDDGSVESSDSISQKSSLIRQLTSGGSLAANHRAISSRLLTSAAASSFLSAASAADCAAALDNLLGSSLNSNSTAESLNMFNIASSLTDNLSSQQVLGQPMTQIVTQNLAIAVVKQSEDELAGDTSIGGHNISIPNGVVAGSTSDKSAGVGVKMVVNTVNPFPNSQNISSRIFSLTFEIGSENQVVEDLLDPIIIDIPGTFNASEYELNVTKPGRRPQCRYFDHDANTWNGLGGEFIGLITNNATGVQYARCAFTHTTDFASAVEYAMPDVNIPDVTKITELNADNMLALIVVLVLLGVYASLMIGLEVMTYLFSLLRGKNSSKQALQRQLHNKTAHSRARRMLDDFKKAHIWIGFFAPPELGRTNFTRSMMLTVIMVSIVGILVSNALTFGRTQANFVQVITAAVFSDLFSTPFIIGFTLLFTLVKRRKKKKQQPPALSENELDNPFNDESLNKNVENYISFQENQQNLSKSDPWNYMEKNIQDKIDHRVQHVSLFSEDSNIHDVATPLVKALIMDEENEYHDMNRLNSWREIFHKRYNIFMDALDDTIVRFQKWNKKMKRNSKVSRLALVIFAIASLAYFSLVGLVNYCIISTITWLGERGAIIFTTLAIVGYIGGVIALYIHSKYKILKLLPPEKEVKVTSQSLFFVVLLSSFLTFCSVVIMVIMVVLYGVVEVEWLKLDYFITILIGCLLVVLLASLLTIFSLYAPKRDKKKIKKIKKERKKKLKKAKKEPGLFPWWFRYVIYLAAWTYILAFSFLIVVYGIQFDSPDHTGGSSRDWLLSSFLGLGQNLVLNKPVMFAVRVIIISSMGVLFEELAASGMNVDVPDVWS